MPELPEVETVKRQLHERLVGRSIISVRILKSGRERPIGADFVSALVGKKIDRVERRAKLLIFYFYDGDAMIAHLKMTGKFVFVDSDYAPGKHDRIIFDVAAHDMQTLVWNDVRQFGFIHVVDISTLNKILSQYGPEPLESSDDLLVSRLVSPKTRTIKSALLHQGVIAGVGNIYADEACHRAGIRPTRRLARMTSGERLHLVRHLKQLLQESIDQRGTSANDYVDTEGNKGGFLSLLRVYGRAGEACLKCRTAIKRIVVAQRGTHYCPRCQT